MRGLLWRLSKLSRVRACGRVSVRPGGHVDVRATGQAVGFAGLALCGSVWACPVCNSRIQAVRRLEVGVAVSHALGTGGGAMFGAYTLRHHVNTDPDVLWRSLSKCWQAVARDRSVKAARAWLGHVGFIRSAEVTHGGNGWHPHLHPVHLFDRPVDADDAAYLHRVQFRAWAASAERLGLEAPNIEAQHLHFVTPDGAGKDLADYLSKVTWEMTSTQTKEGKESRTPWQILRSVYDAEDINEARHDLALWHQWEKVSKGKRALTWSRGVRERCGITVEATDEEIATAVLGSAADNVLTVFDWSPFTRDTSLGPGLLAAVGVGGNAQAGADWCAAHGVAFGLARPF